MSERKKKPDPNYWKLLGTTEVAEILGLSPRTVYEMFASGEIPSVLVKKRRKVRLSDLDAYLERSRKAASSG